ncbi:hypothetical protein [Paraburkholderia sp. A3RO-2L]|jgi:hypothetical protein|uniref:hypothetical protein n=1 Tax=unclassified Paraburkholderia TaxID=2615204 RepID=UPI003DA9324D
MSQKQGFLHAARKLATALVLGLFAGAMSPAALATTPNPDCSIGVDNSSVLLIASFSDLAQNSLPAAVSKAASFTATCSSNATLPLGTYRWVLSAQDLQASVASGSTNLSVLQSLTKSFALSKTTLETNNGLLGYAATYSDSATATFRLSGLNSNLGAGEYRFTQHIAVQRQVCTWLLILVLCSNDGPQSTFSAVFNLKVAAAQVTPPSQPPPSQSGSSGSTGSSNPPVSSNAWPAVTGVSPNPWTVHGYAARTRYRKCYWSVSCRGWSTR